MKMKTIAILLLTVMIFSLLSACENGRRGECYIMSNEVVTMHDMFRLISEAAGLSGRSYVLS